jgi:hypothetical protein
MFHAQAQVWSADGGLATFREPIGQHFRQSGGDNFLLGGRHVILDSAKNDDVALAVIDHIAGARISVTGLANRAGVDEIFVVGLDFDGIRGDFADFVGFDINFGNMGVPMKAELGKLVGEIGHRVETVGDVIPVDGLIQGAVDDGIVRDLANHAEAFQPETLILIELFPGPLQRVGGDWIHVFQRVVFRCVRVMISFDGRAIHLADEIEAGNRIRVVTDNISEADELRDALQLGIGQNSFKSFKVCVDVTENCRPHY